MALYGIDNSKAQESKISFNAWKILAILGCIATLMFYAETMIIPAIPHLIDDLNISYSTSSWILSSYIISGAISVPIAGKLSDTYGKKKILLIVLLIYTVGVIGGAVSTDIYSMLISRTTQGIVLSAFPIVFAIVQDQFPRNKVAIAQGVLVSMFAFGGVLGLIVGGNIIEYLGWRVTFYSVIPVAIMLIILVTQYVRTNESPRMMMVQQKNLLHEHEKRYEIEIDSPDKQMKQTKPTKEVITNLGITARLDIKGIVFLAVTITSFLSALTLVQSSEDNIGSQEISDKWQLIVLSSLGSVSLVAFIIVEKKSSTPIIDFKLIAKKPILISNTIATIWGICTFAIFLTIPILVQSPVPAGGLGGNAVDAANIQLPFSITYLVFGPTSGFIISKIGSSKVTLIGAIVTTFGLFGILFLHGDPVQLATNLAAIGAGLSLLSVGQLNINSTSVSPRFIGVSLGINTLLRYIGAAIGPAVAGTLMQTNQTVINIAGDISKSFPSTESYDSIFIFTLILAAITILLSAKTFHARMGKTVTVGTSE